MSCGIVDDIEDILKQDENNNKNDNIDEIDRINLVNKSYVVPKNLKKFQKTVDSNEIVNADSVIPGCAKIYVKTWGCTHNTSDSEYMAGQLASYGYTIVDSSDDADLWLLNSCTVKNPAEDHFKNYIDKAREKDKYLVLAGCVPQGAPSADYIQGLSIIGVQQIDRIVEVVEETLKGNSVRLFGKKKRNGKKYGGASLNLPKIRKNPLIEIISINTGCLNQCTYCKTKHARGELGSYEPKEIVDRIKQSFEEGVCEVWLTSEDTGAYGRDIGVTIVDLLWQIVECIPDNCMLRIGMTNPPYILEHLEEMAKILNHPRVYSFLHIPVQSASDSVLMDMKREYCLADFCKIVDFLQEKVPDIHIVTDIICGFPTEELTDFEESFKLVEKYKFQSLFINQFFPRPGTPAAKMRQISTLERKRRTKVMSELFHSYTTHDHKLGKVFKVLVTEVSHDGLHYVAHNKFYDQILVEKIDGLMGKMFEVEVYECGKFFMKGKILNKEKVLSEPRVERPINVLSNNNKVKAAVETNGITTTTTCCGEGSCGSCGETDDDHHQHSHEITTNTPEYSKYILRGLFILSIAYLSQVTWRHLIRNK